MIRYNHTGLPKIKIIKKAKQEKTKNPFDLSTILFFFLLLITIALFFLM